MKVSTSTPAGTVATHLPAVYRHKHTGTIFLIAAAPRSQPQWDYVVVALNGSARSFFSNEVPENFVRFAGSVNLENAA